jgi:hypothetical protein
MPDANFRISSFSSHSAPSQLWLRGWRSAAPFAVAARARYLCCDAAAARTNHLWFGMFAFVVCWRGHMLRRRMLPARLRAAVLRCCAAAQGRGIHFASWTPTCQRSFSATGVRALSTFWFYYLEGGCVSSAAFSLRSFLCGLSRWAGRVRSWAGSGQCGLHSSGCLEEDYKGW